MTTIEHIAKHLKEVYFGTNWTWSNLKDQLEDVSLEEAHTKIGDHNSILELSFHINYFVRGVADYFKNGKLEIRDKFSFSPPEINNDEEWLAYKENMYKDVQLLIDAILKLDDSILNDVFVDEKYGVYYRNLTGIIEHCHYHLGQIALLKKLIKQQ